MYDSCICQNPTGQSASILHYIVVCFELIWTNPPRAGTAVYPYIVSAAASSSTEQRAVPTNNSLIVGGVLHCGRAMCRWEGSLCVGRVTDVVA